MTERWLLVLGQIQVFHGRNFPLRLGLAAAVDDRPAPGPSEWLCSPQPTL